MTEKKKLPMPPGWINLWDHEPPPFETNILVDKFEVVDGEWTFEMKDGYWGKIPADPIEFIGWLIHLLQKEWFTKNDAWVLIDWAVVKHKWDIHGQGFHSPFGLMAASRGNLNKSKAN